MFGKHNRRKKESETPLKRRLTSIKQSACPFETTHTNISSKHTRTLNRINTFKFAEISTPSGESIACIVLDLSDAGARIALKSRAHIEGRVLLKILETGTYKTAYVAWQTDDNIGLSFN